MLNTGKGWKADRRRAVMWQVLPTKIRERRERYTKGQEGDTAGASTAVLEYLDFSLSFFLVQLFNLSMSPTSFRLNHLPY